MIEALQFVETGYLKLDGGAMFGVVPKTIWEKLNPPDNQNLCTWSMRCLLISTNDRKILVDTGMGDKQDVKFRSFFHPHGGSLDDALQNLEVSPEAITDVLLTHLHFDHCGGAVIRDAKGQLVPAFPNARYWSNERHWDWACKPNDRERASFLRENFIPLQDHGVLHFIENDKATTEWLPGINLRFLYGHTEAMMIPEIDFENRKYIYCADLIPSSHHIGMPYIMSYDVRPLVTLQEKDIVLQQAADHEHVLLFEHDPNVRTLTVVRNEQGRIVAGRQVNL
ncbi:MAG: MBL fold metallo-hydrolase [Saprospiraceae bacterium]|jgi:glyoxylase-like metal-dependent hydrolase (beta-lactamase superfamily II)|nr:MBL fold metallo-hydrolase [Saprospiraceae bacterium]MBP9210843.1 MBL fold metallo-hydrolase [Saprospiraceae bacterium]MBV6471782.1 putative quorum-quenching lactonase YtnP [Saprospiraceae bacterium]